MAMASEESVVPLWAQADQMQAALDRLSKTGLETGGGPGDSGGMEARVAVLEQIAKTTSETLKEIKDELVRVRDRQERDFRLTWGGMIIVALGLAGLMAKGFKWF